MDKFVIQTFTQMCELSKEESASLSFLQPLTI